MMNALFASQPGSYIRLRQEGRTEEVVRRLMEAIDLGLYGEGQQLPSETELAGQFGVATVTLRDALAYLRQRGVIETRRGRTGGSFVCATPQGPHQRLLARHDARPPLQRGGQAARHPAIAGAAARLAARRAGPEHHQQLARYVQALDEATCRRDLRRADARFHIEIAVASQSVRLTHAEIRLQAEVGELLWLPSDGAPAAAEVREEHRAIADAIAAGDATRAGSLAEVHVERGIRRLGQLKLQLLANQQG